MACRRGWSASHAKRAQGVGSRGIACYNGLGSGTAVLPSPGFEGEADWRREGVVALLVRLSRETLEKSTARQVEEISGQSLARCNQCGQCSSGCPAATAPDLLPNQVIRSFQLGLPDGLRSRIIWLCAACLACAARCPSGLDLARVMEAARAISLRQGLSPVALESLSDAAAGGYPQQAVVAAFRKYVP